MISEKKLPESRTERIGRMIAALMPWYRQNARTMPWREDPTPYHVWLSEIMLQQTRIETVIPYYLRFVREIPDIPSLAGAEPEKLMKLWEGLGYYSRARNLQTAAQQIMSRFGGCFPENYEEIRSLSGIGDYTAGAISSICFDLPTPAVDGNVLRVISRITEDPRPITDEKIKKTVRDELAAAYPAQERGSCTQAIMELGETVCLPNGAPGCVRCPCRDFCGSAEGGWNLYPVKAEKKARRREKLTVLILRCGDTVAVRKRPEKGLLSGLWELPNRPGHLTVTEAMNTAAEWGCLPVSLCAEEDRSHIFTHIEWEMRCYSVECACLADGFCWADAREFRNSISLPTAFRKVLDPFLARELSDPNE